MYSIYREMLVNRARFVQRAKPPKPEEPLSYIQYKNRLAVKRWREKLEKVNE